MQIYNINQNLTLPNIDDKFPTNLIIPNQQTIHISENTTAYGFIATNQALLVMGEKALNLYAGMYFCTPGEAYIHNMSGFICLRENYHGLLTLGGPVEETGRMRYIDGSSDTLLLSPVMYGDPCLNYLYVPADTHQTMHTHPSVRVGCILEGAGYTLTKTARFDLLPGNIFVVYPGEEHCIHTENNHLRITVFHPDSDFGPTHEAHPMINQTYYIEE